MKIDTKNWIVKDSVPLAEDEGG